jgi:glycosyltransferase involved in cell wall biosynthesis
VVRPRLTIAIPTWNRASILATGLAAAFRARVGCSQQVEIVVSDNASSDDTPAVAAAWHHEPNFRYFRHPENIGGCANILYVARELAQGDFCWIVGDDDLIFPGAIRRILDLIESHPDVDAFLINHAFDKLSVRDALAISADVSAYQAVPGMINLTVTTSGRYPRLAEVLEQGEGRFEPFTQIGGQVFRPERWRGHRTGESENFGVTPRFDTLYATFPHLGLLLRTTPGPVYYCGEVLFLASLGAQEWSADGGWLKCVLASEAMPRWYKLTGVRAPYLALMRRYWMNYWLGYRHELAALRKNGGTYAGLSRQFFTRSLRHPLTFLRCWMPYFLTDTYARLPEPFQKTYRMIRKRISGQTAPSSSRP